MPGRIWQIGGLIVISDSDDDAAARSNNNGKGNASGKSERVSKPAKGKGKAPIDAKPMISATSAKGKAPAKGPQTPKVNRGDGNATAKENDTMPKVGLPAIPRPTYSLSKQLSHRKRSCLRTPPKICSNQSER